jgi:hypothetical protein
MPRSANGIVLSYSAIIAAWQTAGPGKCTLMGRGASRLPRSMPLTFL